MNRRQLIAGAAAAVVAPAVAVQAADTTIEDKYWEAQWQISEYENDRQEMRSHRAALEINSKLIN